MFISVALVHSSARVVPLLTEVARDVMADVELIHMVDEGMERLIDAAGELTEPVTRRVCACAMNAEEAEAEAVMLTSPDIGLATEAARAAVRIPVLRIDQAMAETAAQFGASVGVVSARDTSLASMLSLLRDRADTQGKPVEFEPRLCEAAGTALAAGEMDAYDAAVLTAVDDLADADVIVLADVMMHRVVHAAAERTEVPVLETPRHGFEDLAKQLNYFRR